MIRTKRRKKRVSESRLPAPVPERPNELWSIDFMADRLGSGEKFRTLNAIDGATRECVGIAVERSLPAIQVTEPGTLLLLETGVASLGLLGRRARRNQR